ncbi:MAG TPA: acetyl-CoA carboxylase biotin carboxyl carrier protein [Candidatus Eisenbacteria bacterium]
MAPKGVKPGAGGSDNAQVGGFELGEIRRLIRLVQRTGIGEIELTSGGRTVRIAATPGSATVTLPAPPARGPEPATPPAGGAAPPAETAAGGKLVTVASPMVGTFYRAPAPDADPYVELGSLVEVGQTICIVEAMKLMNEIESEVRGRVVRILAENTQPVEFGQALFQIEPA